jgi:hypothetical protein
MMRSCMSSSRWCLSAVLLECMCLSVLLTKVLGRGQPDLYGKECRTHTLRGRFNLLNMCPRPLLQTIMSCATNCNNLDLFHSFNFLFGNMRCVHARCFFLWFNWGSAIVLADHTRFSWANPTAGSLRHCLTSKTRHAPNTRRCPAPGPKTARELNPHTSLVLQLMPHTPD